MDIFGGQKDLLKRVVEWGGDRDNLPFILPVDPEIKHLPNLRYSISQFEQILLHYV